MPKRIILNQFFRGAKFPMAETRFYVGLNNVLLMVIDILKVSLEVALQISQRCFKSLL